MNRFHFFFSNFTFLAVLHKVTGDLHKIIQIANLLFAKTVILFERDIVLGVTVTVSGYAFYSFRLLLHSQFCLH